VSDDGRSTAVVIVLFGNPFSPSYARARARGASRPLDYCALHVALEGPLGRRWSLRERAVNDAARGRSALAIGASRVAWIDDRIVMDIDETTTPGGLRLQGRVVLRAESLPGKAVSLDPGGDHHWWPAAPIARATVDFREPPMRFEGHGYSDANAGRVPLDSTFASWSWSRARLDASRAVVGYDVVDRKGGETTRTMVFDASGTDCRAPMARTRLPLSRWGLARRVNADENASARVIRPLEDGPCYARALVSTRLFGREAVAIHEVLSGDRLRRAWVRFLLGFRMGRCG
jgi:carotenoid 1,2-hydratase